MGNLGRLGRLGKLGNFVILCPTLNALNAFNLPTLRKSGGAGAGQKKHILRRKIQGAQETRPAAYLTYVRSRVIAAQRSSCPLKYVFTLPLRTQHPQAAAEHHRSVRRHSAVHPVHHPEPAVPAAERRYPEMQPAKQC